MASKEEINRRVESAAEAAWNRWNDSPASETPRTAMVRTVRPLVERVIELEEESAELRERLDGSAPKLAAAEERVIEQGRTIEVLNADRSRILADLTEARAGWRTAEREHDETTAALRAQVAALQGVIDGHEQAIRDACADEQESFAAERMAAKLRHNKLAEKIVALETTVDVLAGRLAQRGGGS